jgi:hypothetical protein
MFERRTHPFFSNHSKPASRSPQSSTLSDLMVGPGKTARTSARCGSLIPDHRQRTRSLHTNTNFDADPNTAGIQPSDPIVIELLDDEAPLCAEFRPPPIQNTSAHSSPRERGFYNWGGFASSSGTTSRRFDLHNEFIRRVRISGHHRHGQTRSARIPRPANGSLIQRHLDQSVGSGKTAASPSSRVLPDA